jgi:hypothetical protein
MDGAQPFGSVGDGAVGAAKGKVAWIGRVPDVPAVGAGKLEHRRQGASTKVSVSPSSPTCCVCTRLRPLTIWLQQNNSLGRAEIPGKWKKYLESHVPSASGLFEGMENLGKMKIALDDPMRC